MARRKDIPCGLCGHSTRDDQGVCRNCRTVYALGLTARQRLQDGHEQEAAYVANDIRLTGYAGEPQERADREMIALILDLAQAQKCEAAYSFADDKREAVGDAPKCRGFSYGKEPYLFPIGNAAKVDQLFRAIRNWAAYHHQTGRREGERFIQRIANGELTVAEINDRLAR